LKKGILADFAKQLTFGSVILVEIDLRSVATWTFAVIRDIAFGAPFHRLYRFVIVLISPLEVFHEVPVIPRLYMEYQREFIHFELLIFGRMGIIESPLL
jgi:hypothetical protein